MKATHNRLAVVSTALALVGATVVLCAPSASAHAWWNGMFCRLAGSTINKMVPQGESEFMSTITNGKTGHFLEVEVSQINLTSGSTLSVSVGGQKVGTFPLKGHTGILQLNTAKGAILPAAKKGDSVTVSDPTGKVILSGKY